MKRTGQVLAAGLSAGSTAAFPSLLHSVGRAAKASIASGCNGMATLLTEAGVQ